jgi:hypothetical protein
MKKCALTILLMAILSPLSGYSLETTVEIIGSEDLAKLKDGIEKSIAARCIAKGIDLSPYERLTISIAKLGETISFDAVLKTEPPKAFHKDIKGADAISPTIDEMLTVLFVPPVLAPAPPPTPPLAQNAIETVVLPLQAISITSLGDTIFLCDKKTIYTLKGDRTDPWWKVPGKEEIYRISAYKGSIIALVKHFDAFRSYRITDGQTMNVWPNVVLPQGDGLVTAVLNIVPDITRISNRWTKASVVEGNPSLLPANTDIIATVVQDVYPQHEGPEIISFTNQGSLAVSAAKETFWSSAAKFGTLPLYLEQEYMERGGGKGDEYAEIQTRTERYYMPPRILVSEGMIITIDNNEGILGVLSNTKLYKSAKIRAYAWTGDDFEERILSKTSSGYCMDIDLHKNMLVEVIVQKKGTMLKFTNLKKG